MNIKKIKKTICISGMSINEVQNKAGMKAGSLYRLLNGTSKGVTLTTAFNLADALGVDINEFREEKEDEKTNNKNSTDHNRYCSSCEVSAKESEILC